MNTILQTAHWEHSKKKATLLADKNALIEIELSKKVANVKFGKEKYEISKEGFWCPQIIIKRKDEVVASQKNIGLWGTKSEFEIDGKTYNAKTKQGTLFNITYSRGDNDILTYKLDALKNNPVINFKIKSFAIPEKHLLILLALGFYSIKNVAVEGSANDFIVTAVA